jgi:hypothetical protein
MEIFLDVNEPARAPLRGSTYDARIAAEQSHDRRRRKVRPAQC